MGHDERSHLPGRTPPAAWCRHERDFDAVARLAGSIAHEFDSLLTVILGRSTLLLTSPRPQRHLRRDIGIISEAASRAAGVMRQLQAFSARQEHQPAAVDVNALIDGLVESLEDLVGPAIRLVWLPGPRVGCASADRARLEEVIRELAANARDAMPEGGRLLIQTANLDLDDRFVAAHPDVRPGPHVLLAVHDTGMGMDALTRGRLFEPFFSTKERGRRRGMGLATAYGTVRQCGGHIWADSEPGRGTTFRIVLPRLESPDCGRRPPGDARTVLVATHDLGLRHLARDVLGRAGFAVLEASSPGEAFTLSARHPDPIDLLLADLGLPRMSARDLAAHLVWVRPGMKVVYLSGATNGHGAGPDHLAAGTLQKPFTAGALEDAVRCALGIAPTGPVRSAARRGIALAGAGRALP
jgi:two-component system, cell cycle sensor histidine kinase and response regulator CckA